MILPPGETDKHMFDLEAAAKKLEALEKVKQKYNNSSHRITQVWESISPQYHTAGNHSWPREVNSHFLKLLHRDSVTKINVNSYSSNKMVHLEFLQKVLGKKVDSPQYDAAGSQFFHH